MRLTISCITLASLLGTSFPAASEPPLGRLFMTPEQRAAIDRQRQQAGVDHGPASQPGNLTVNGLVKRSNGKTTTWVNGVEAGNAMPLQDDLQVGQSINPGNPERTDLLRGGSILIQRDNRSSRP